MTRSIPSAEHRDRAQWQRSLLGDDDIPPGAKLLALMLSVYTDDAGEQGVWFSLDDFSRLSGLTSIAVVRRYLAQLQTAGWLTVAEDRGGTIRHLGWPAPGLPAFGMVPARGLAVADE